MKGNIEGVKMNKIIYIYIYMHETIKEFFKKSNVRQEQRKLSLVKIKIKESLLTY